MPRTINLSDGDIDALDILKRVRFVTVEQLSYWLKVSPTSAYRRLRSLAASRLVKVFSEFKPHIFRLSDSGLNRMGLAYQARWYSAPSMHQYLMRNEAEIFYQTNIESDFRLVDRGKVRPFGLTCQVGEHPGRLRGELVLVLIDDYLMSPDRVLTVLDRVHETKNNREYIERIRTGGRAYVPTWRNAVKRLILITTNQPQITTFEVAFRKKPIKIPFEIHLVPGLWNVS